MWIIPRTFFARGRVLLCLVQHQFLGLATTAAALALGEKIFGLRPVDGLMQQFRQMVSHALGRNIPLDHKFNDIGVMSSLVSLHCGELSLNGSLHVGPF